MQYNPVGAVTINHVTSASSEDDVISDDATPTPTHSYRESFLSSMCFNIVKHSMYRYYLSCAYCSHVHVHTRKFDYVFYILIFLSTRFIMQLLTAQHPYLLKQVLISDLKLLLIHHQSHLLALH